jgi:excisionase family DNA binding protein
METREEVFTPQEAAAYLKVNLRTIYRKIKKGVIPCLRLDGRLIRIRKQDLDSLFVKEKN